MVANMKKMNNVAAKNAKIANKVAKTAAKAAKKEDKKAAKAAAKVLATTQSASPKASPKMSPKASKKAEKKAAKQANKTAKQENATAIKLIQKALNDGFGFPAHQIIKQLVQPCLEKPCLEKTQIEIQGTAMIEKHMVDTKQHLEHVIQTAKHELASTVAEELVLTAQRDQLSMQKQLLDEQAVAVDVKEEQEKLALEDCEKMLKAEKKNFKETMESGPRMEKDLATIMKMLETEYVKLINGVDNKKDAQKFLKIVIDVCKNILNFEAAMLAPLPNVLVQKPSERGAFGNLLLQEVDKAVRFFVADAQQKIEAHPSRVTVQEQKLNHVESERKRCADELEVTKLSVVAVNEKIETTKKQLAENAKGLKSHPKNVATGEDKVQEATERQAKWESVLAAFEMLKTFNPKPVEEVKEDDADMEEVKDTAVEEVSQPSVQTLEEEEEALMQDDEC